jgi:hypothetical protein
LYDHQLRIIMDDEGAGHVICAGTAENSERTARWLAVPWFA